MPTVYTGSYKIPYSAGKGIGAIQAEKESYTRGVEQARLDMQKKKIADDQMMRKLARIDAEEKETRRQQEWDAIAKRSREAVTESTRRWEEEQRTKGEMTDYQEQIIEAKKRAEQERIDKINRDKAWLKKIQEGQNVGGQVTQPTATTPTQQPAPQQQGIMGLLAQKQDEWKGVPYRRPEQAPAQPEIKKGYTPPSDIADLSTGDRDVLESIHKQLKPLNEAKLRQEANIEAYGKYGAGTKAKIAAISIYNNKIKQIESDNKKVKSELIKTQNEVRENKRKAKKAIEKEMKKAGNPTQAQITLAKQALSPDGLGAGYTAEEMEKHTKWAKGIQARVIAMGGAGQAGTEQAFGAEQEKLIQENIQAHGRSREEIIQALKAKGLL